MIEIKNLNKTYDKKSRNANHVLRDISLTLPDTGFVCIVGTSGCGKTSLLNAIGGLDTFDNGTIATQNTAVSKSGTREYEQERNNSFSYIFQNYYLLSDHSVAYNVYLGLHSLALSHKERLARVKEALEAVNMSRYARRIVGELSGGQQQRVAIARALARRPRVIFADEPTGNLDEENTRNICTLLRKISKTSLVVMVTHEEHIARFFADRIITLGDGKILSDEDGWKRGNLEGGVGSTLYTQDYEEEQASAQSVQLRVLTQEGAAPANLTIVLLGEKIIIKTDDGRPVSCTKAGESPVLVEGKSPVISLEELDGGFTHTEPDVPAKAGTGFSLRMMFEQARRFMQPGGVRRRSVRFFLIAMTVLTVWMVGDYLTVSDVDPRNFITSDSHILDLKVERGAGLDPFQERGVISLMPEFIEKLKGQGIKFDLLPHVTSSTASIAFDSFPQVTNVSVKLQRFSYVPVDWLDESKLIYGRMPQNSEEIVVDRWVLDYVLAQDGVVQNSIWDISQFLGKRPDFFKKKYKPEIVGICDCGDPSIYMTKAALISVGDMGTELITFSEFQSRYPGVYEGGPLAPDECIVVTNNAGIAYMNKVGSSFLVNSTFAYDIAAAIKADTYANLIVPDESLEALLVSMNNFDYSFYTADQQEMKAAIEEIMGKDYADTILYGLEDRNGQAQEKYREAASLKADARIIVTFTIIVLSMVMLYLLQRAYVQERIGMMAVYRLLGLPKRKLAGIFALESLMLSLESVLPAAAVTWLAVAVLNLLTDLGFSMILPWQAGALAGLGIMVYYLLISLLPVGRLLKLAPARLAAKYDI